jgi:hypothetical protein
MLIEYIALGSMVASADMAAFTPIQWHTRHEAILEEGKRESWRRLRGQSVAMQG